MPASASHEWPAMFQILYNPNSARVVAGAISLVCVFLTAHYAQKIRKERPRAFIALSLLALNWALLLLYYLPGAPETELLSSYSGFLLIIVGGLLYREAVAEQSHDTTPPLTWLDTIPLFLFRITVVGFGVYYLVKRLFRWEYGWGTLTLALWGTLLTVFGYCAIWLAVVSLHRGRPTCGRAALWMGILLAAYSAAEITYTAWYALDYWPPYSRFLTLQAHPDSPDFHLPLPFHPQPDWPEAAAWQHVAAERIRGVPVPQLVSLQAQPSTPETWPWLTYLLSVLKLALTIGLLVAVVRIPPRDPRLPPLPLHRWLDRNTGLKSDTSEERRDE